MLFDAESGKLAAFERNNMGGTSFFLARESEASN
jgi:hypothetical protein